MSIQKIVLRDGQRNELSLANLASGLQDDLDVAMSRFYRRVNETSNLSSDISAKATERFVTILSSSSYGEHGEGSFFQEHPKTCYFGVQGSDLDSYRFGHRLALLVTDGGSMRHYIGIDLLPKKNDKDQTKSVIFHTSQMKKQVNGSNPAQDELIQALTEHYGGRWGIEYSFDQRSDGYYWRDRIDVGFQMSFKD